MQLRSQISTGDQSFKDNYSFHIDQLQQLQERLERARTGGGPKAHARQEQQGKWPVRKRIAHLIDPGSELLELSALAGEDLYEDKVPCAGVVTGIGLVHGRAVMIVANDPTVKGGTYYPITVKKHLRAQEIAEKHHLPCVYLVDSGGAFLPRQDEVFPDREHFGRIFYNQAQMSAKGIPQISSVHGFCTAGGAYIPAMSDQSVIVKGTGTIFLAGPPLVKAATGEEVTAEELGGSHVHTAISGVADHEAENDEHAIALLRKLLLHIDRSQAPSPLLKQSVAPAYDPDEILGVLPSDNRKFFDIKEVIARLVDGSEFFAFKPNYGSTLVTGFAHINGMPVGIIGNNGVLFSESALKATHFIELCCQEQKPLIFLQNITGFIVGKKYEHQGIAKDGAKMVHAVANASVPKFTVMVGGSYGAGNYGMCGRAFDPNLLFMWPNARISVMGGEQAADVLANVKKHQLERSGQKLSEAEFHALRAPILQKYEQESSAYYSTARLWDDGLIDPRRTREVLSMALAASLQYTWPKTRFGVFRM